MRSLVAARNRVAIEISPYEIGRGDDLVGSIFFSSILREERGETRVVRVEKVPFHPMVVDKLLADRMAKHP
jgi:hypothetical protein